MMLDVQTPKGVGVGPALHSGTGHSSPRPKRPSVIFNYGVDSESSVDLSQPHFTRVSWPRTSCELKQQQRKGQHVVVEGHFLFTVMFSCFRPITFRETDILSCPSVSPFVLSTRLSHFAGSLNIPVGAHVPRPGRRFLLISRSKRDSSERTTRR
ncbi:hypothetical protein EYF80_023812 [Liparis tanakae]|uniref:Uncharacterized protein n=1 Tax=Liparis tanakae TaxID=230148 RepID=A0A4Z2HJ56_9TELE|nr:hypothetical protein EYF80_023812 [Liparis tanakae]